MEVYVGISESLIAYPLHCSLQEYWNFYSSRGSSRLIYPERAVKTMDFCWQQLKMWAMRKQKLQNITHIFAQKT